MSDRIFNDPSARTDAGFYQPWRGRQRLSRPARDIRAEIRARLDAAEEMAAASAEASPLQLPLIVAGPKSKAARPGPVDARRSACDAWAPQKPDAAAKASALTIVPLPIPPWRRILTEVCAAREVATKDVLGPRRTRSMTRVRQEAMYRIADGTTLSLTEIGQRMGRDHTTVLHGMRMHAERNGLPRLVGLRGHISQVDRP